MARRGGVGAVRGDTIQLAESSSAFQLGASPRESHSIPSLEMSDAQNPILSCSTPPQGAGRRAARVEHNSIWEA